MRTVIASFKAKRYAGWGKAHGVALADKMAYGLCIFDGYYYVGKREEIEPAGIIIEQDFEAIEPLPRVPLL